MNRVGSLFRAQNEMGPLRRHYLLIKHVTLLEFLNYANTVSQGLMCVIHITAAYAMMIYTLSCTPLDLCQHLHRLTEKAHFPIYYLLLVNVKILHCLPCGSQSFFPCWSDRIDLLHLFEFCCFY